ncbi:MAG: hypothetical protein GWP25_05740 [Euryarchaeota archaeon]|nr:hypothetical protein [Euryarchaeota archaeon]
MILTPSISFDDSQQSDANLLLSQDVHTVGERTTTYSVSPVNGWTTGGEEITITGTEFPANSGVWFIRDSTTHQWNLWKQ